MKKHLLIITVIITLIISSSIQTLAGVVKVGKISGDYENITLDEVNKTEQVNFINIEAVNPTDFSNIEMGLGIELHQPSSIPTITGEFYMVPIYISMTVYCGKNMINPYFFTRLGYSIFTGNKAFIGSYELKGGSYIGLGTGLKIADHFYLDLLYSVSDGTYDTYEIRYTRKSLALGYGF